jgi:hypothetical protein
MFVGASHAHSSNIGRILNLRTGHVSPQYHVVYDDLFSTVPNAESGGVDDQMPFNPLTWNQIVSTGHERTIDPVEEASTGTRYVPSLDKEWLSDDELLQQNESTTVPVPASEDQQPQLLQGPEILPPAPEPMVEPSLQVSPPVLPPEGEVLSEVSSSSEGGIELPQELSEGGVTELPASVREDVPSSNQEPKS